MPQTGPDLVSAGYPISRPLLALLGGTSNLTQPNVPAKTNLDFALGSLVDGTAAGGGGVTASPGGSMLSVAIPVSPGDIVSKITYMVGGTSAASANVTNQWAALYTGTGSAPGTVGAQPALIGQTASLAATNVASVTALTFTFANPQTISAVQAPFGYIYASYSITTGSSTGPSFASMAAASVVTYPWFATSPPFFAATSNSTLGSAAPATMSVATRIAQVPVVILT